jgi:hypothetical protein
MTADIIDYNEFSDDVALEAEDKAKVGRHHQEWLKMTKGQVILGALVYFHAVDATAAKAFRWDAKRAFREATPEEIKVAAQKALEARASSLTPAKTVDELTADERLDLSLVQFKSFRAHYKDRLGFVLSRLGKDGVESDRIWSKLPPAQQYFSTLLLIYPTTREGKHDVDAIKTGKWRLLPWRFSRRTYDDLWDLHNGLRSNQMSLAGQDIRMECHDATYQKISVSFVGKSAWQSHDGFKKTVLAQAMRMYGKLVPFREVSTDQLRHKLGLPDASSEDWVSALDIGV